MVYSGWKFILVLVFGRMTSNFICLTFSTLRSSSLWRIGTIFLSLDKTVYRREPQVLPRETLLLSVKILSCNLHEIKIYTSYLQKSLDASSRRKLTCKHDTREEAKLYDEFSVGIYRLSTSSSQDQELVGHLPIELSFLLVELDKGYSLNSCHFKLQLGYIVLR